MLIIPLGFGGFVIYSDAHIKGFMINEFYLIITEIKETSSHYHHGKVFSCIQSILVMDYQ